MDTCSYFIKDKALFGSYPSQEQVRELEDIGVRYFIDLTDPETEFYKVIKYETRYNYISYPIKDHSVPTDLQSFTRLILNIEDILKSLKNDEKLFLNCLGGHGRSGIVVSSVLCFIFQISPKDALEYTRHFHNNRKIMREKWRKLGSPQTIQQKKFVMDFFEPYNLFYKDKTTFFTNHANIPVLLPNFKLYTNADEALREISNKGTSLNIELYSYIFTLKLLQNQGTLEKFLQTLLRPIDCEDNKIFGKILNVIKYKMLKI